MATNRVELGFVEEVDNPVRISSPFFPSKVGGKPAWLARSGLPDSQSLRCKNCEKPLIFLLQVYVPSDQELETTFHRTLFVFCCRDGACHKPNSNACFTAFRCQLARVNEFYDPEPCEDEDVHHVHVSAFQKRESEMKGKWSPLCEVCGCAGEKRCGRCSVMRYCGKEHQTIDWRRGHKLRCCKETTDNVQAGSLSEKSNTLLFPEYELLTEPEETVQDKSDDEGDEDEYQKYMKESTDAESRAVSDSEWELLAAESKKINNADKTFLEFKKRISYDPDQVLRYQRNGEPLWVAKPNMLEGSDVPKCPCGAERTFEFQILPQLLNHLKVDVLEASVDWGTVVVYTCSKDCSSETIYNKEFVWEQDFSETGLPADILSKLQE